MTQKVLQRRRSTEANQTVHNVWPFGLIGYLYIFGGCCLVTEFCQVQNLLCVLQVLHLLYWQHYCTALGQWVQAELCGVEHMALPIFSRATITLGIAHILVYI